MQSTSNADAQSRRVFKIATSGEWSAAEAIGYFSGSPDDIRDGYIHLSTADQVAGTLAKHFKARDDLLLIAFQTEDIRDRLRWERSRGGELFPHYFGSLRTDLAKIKRPVPIGPDGQPAASPDLLAC